MVAGMLLALPVICSAHNISADNARFVEGIDGPAIAPFMYLGAKHMVTGYDHLLFLLGVIFFLYRARDILLFVTLFTLGHSITLMTGVLLEVNVNAYLIDAIIGMSVVYKAFENIDGFRQVFAIQFNAKVAVFIFGLFHGLGLATKLQEFALSSEGLVTNIVSFNIGVELGQAIALAFILLVLLQWRQRESFQNHAFVTNTFLMTAGFVLTGYQLAGYMWV
jgi:hypothetical protein|tara:strand:- start:436 stop:1098 length:663 start_codon:yes stop_codon:yes gene_type:complete